jgi:hypothetical protein
VTDPHNGSTTSVIPVEYGAGNRVAEDFRWSWVFDQFDVDVDQRGN